MSSRCSSLIRNVGYPDLSRKAWVDQRQGNRKHTHTHFSRRLETNICSFKTNTNRILEYWSTGTMSSSPSIRVPSTPFPSIPIPSREDIVYSSIVEQQPASSLLYDVVPVMRGRSPAMHTLFLHGSLSVLLCFLDPGRRTRQVARINKKPK